MNNKKNFWGVVFLFCTIFVLLSACTNTSDESISETGTQMPGIPVFSQYVLDCRTGNSVSPGELIQPGATCDNWETNLFERPFNAVAQDEYYPDLDILFAELGQGGDWFYIRIAVFDPRPGSKYLEGAYAIEIDYDDDGRGDLLALVNTPGKENGSEWSKTGVQIWTDSDNDIGGIQPKFPDDGFEGNGYDLLIFDEGVGDDPNAAWSRAFMEGSAYVEIAIKKSFLGGIKTFKWWVWSDNQKEDPSLFDYNDNFTREDAGDPNESLPYFPTNKLAALDNTCAAFWGGMDKEDSSLCVNDPSAPVPPSGGDMPDDCPAMDFEKWKEEWYTKYPQSYPMPQSLLGLYYQEYLDGLECDPPPPPEIPGDCPPLDFEKWKEAWYSENPNSYPQPYSLLLTYYADYLENQDCDDPDPEEPCVMSYKEWSAWYYNEYPGEYPQPYSLMLTYYEDYLSDPFCPEDSKATPTFTLMPTSTPTLTPSPTIPIPTPTLACKPSLNRSRCLDAGGKWISADPKSGRDPYCQCP